VVLISGASTGIGRATALRLASAGFTVLAGVRRQQDGAALAEAGPVEPVILDVTDEASIAAAAKQATELGDGQVAGLVNNAGVSINGPFEALTVADWRRQFEVNLFGHVAMTNALLPAVLAAKGRIVNVGSIGGRMALPIMGPYTASKHAVRGWSDAMRGELATQGVHVALIEPGAIKTPMWEKGQSEADVLEEGLSQDIRERYGATLAALRKTATRTEGMAIPPERVAKRIEHAMTSSRPRPHYLVGTDAHIQAGVAMLPARTVDRALRLLTGVGRKQ